MKKKIRVVENFKIVKRSCSLNRYYRVPTKDLICMLFKSTYLPCKIKVHSKGFNKSLWTISAFQKVFKTGRISKIILKWLHNAFQIIFEIYKINLEFENESFTRFRFGGVHKLRLQYLAFLDHLLPYVYIFYV